MFREDKANEQYIQLCTYEFILRYVVDIMGLLKENEPKEKKIKKVYNNLNATYIYWIIHSSRV